MVVGGTGRARSGDFARPESRRGTWLADKVESETMDEVGARVLSRSCESRVTEDETEVVCEYRALTGESVFRTRRFRGESKEDFEKLRFILSRTFDGWLKNSESGRLRVKAG